MDPGQPQKLYLCNLRYVKSRHFVQKPHFTFSNFAQAIHSKLVFLLMASDAH